MEELKDYRQGSIVMPLIAAEPRGQDHQQGPQPFTPTAHNMSPDRGDERNTGGEIPVYFSLNPIQIGADSCIDSFFEVLAALSKEPGGNR